MTQVNTTPDCEVDLWRVVLQGLSGSFEGVLNFVLMLLMEWGSYRYSMDIGIENEERTRECNGEGSRRPWLEISGELGMD